MTTFSDLKFIKRYHNFETTIQPSIFKVGDQKIMILKSQTLF